MLNLNNRSTALDQLIERANNTEGLKSLSINVQLGNSNTAAGTAQGIDYSSQGLNNVTNYLNSNGLNSNIEVKRGAVGPIPAGSPTKNAGNSFSIDAD
jgi:hypothetical protein